MMSDEDLVRAIGEALRNLYDDINRQPLPPKIKAALARIEHPQHQGSNLSRPPSHGEKTPLGF